MGNATLNLNFESPGRLMTGVCGRSETWIQSDDHLFDFRVGVTQLRPAIDNIGSECRRVKDLKD